MSRRKRTLLAAAQRDGDALGAGARGAADAVDVALGHVGQLVVDDVRHLVDVDAARGDVGCHEPADAAGAEGAECRLALALALVAVDRGDLDAGGLEMARDLVGAALGAREDERAPHGRIGEQLDQQRLLPLRSTWMTLCCTRSTVVARA